jgi:2-iminobutanoate/2-iminopropanoate deaminase
MKKVLMRPGFPTTLPFSHAVIATGSLLFISGQGPIDPETGTVIDGDFAAQTRQTFENLKAVAAVAGADLSRAVKVNGYLRDTADFATYNEIYREYFTGDLPARTTVQSDLAGMLVEVDAVLALDAD